jgi:hypothetical protein
MARSGEWRYLAQRFDGTGNLGDFIDLNLPLEGVEITEVLSGHNSMSATITPALSRLKGSDGRPVFTEWGVCLWAESPNGEVYGGILESSGFSGPEWSLTCTDISGVLIDCPFDQAVGFENVDPLDLFRYIWIWYQSRPGCNFGITTDMTSSPIRLGTEYTQIEDFDAAGGLPEDAYAVTAPSSYATNEEWVDKAVKKLKKLPNGWSATVIRDALEEWLAGPPYLQTEQERKIVKKARQILGEPPGLPAGVTTDPTPTVTDPVVYQVDSYKMNWYSTQDVSSNVDDLAANTPFDWKMIHRWSDDGDEADLQHHIRLGYPRLEDDGRVTKTIPGVGPRFVIGENIHEIPDIERDGEEFANDVIVLGNGEGSSTVHGRAYRPTPGRMRRTVVVTDQTLGDVQSCVARAEEEISRRAMLEDITELVLIDHPNAPFGSLQLGQEFTLEGQTDWFNLSVRVRCVGRTFRPDEGGQMRISIIRTDRIG